MDITGNTNGHMQLYPHFVKNISQFPIGFGALHHQQGTVVPPRLNPVPTELLLNALLSLILQPMQLSRSESESEASPQRRWCGEGEAV